LADFVAIIAILRDIAIIIVATIDIVILGTLAVLTVMGYRYFLRVRAATPDLIERSRSTLTEVKGTTDFVLDTAVTPLIRILAVVSALQRFIAVLFGGQRRRI
jgi:hypothetical protein